MKHIDRIIKENINRFLLKESLNNVASPLYHSTTIEGALNIMDKDCMQSNENSGFGDVTHNCICFSRDKKYQVYVESCVQFVINPQKLINKTRGCKLIPFQDSSWEGFGEMEERLVSKSGKDFIIQNVSDAVIKVNIFIFNLVEYISNEYNSDYALNVISYLKEMQMNTKYLNKIHFYLENSSRKNGKNEMTLDEAIEYIKERFDIYEEEENDEKYR